MNINPVSAQNQNSKTGTFKSVIQIHHWTYNDKVMTPVSDIKNIDKFQKKIAHIFNRRMSYSKKSSTAFFNRIIEYLGQNDKDYKEIPYVVTFYNKNAKQDAERKGEPLETAPYAYLLTGKDAIKFQDRFLTPVKNLDVNDKDTKTQYFYDAIKFIIARSHTFLEKKNLELHAIYTGEDLIKIGFYPTKGKDNPYVKLGYKK